MARELFQIILPAEMNPMVFRERIFKAMRRETEIHEGMFGKATATWKHKPFWVKSFVFTGKDAFSILRTSDKPFLYVEGGTRRRWRRMSSNWTSKTKPKRLYSGPGSGKAEGWRKNPYPGIEPRDFRVRIAEIRQPKYAKKMAIAFGGAARGVFIGSSTII